MGALSQEPQLRLAIGAEEDVGAARRAVARMAARLPAIRASEAELAATELAANLFRHASGGYLLCRPAGGGIELISVDHGPGLRPGSLSPAPMQRLADRPHAGGLGLGLGLGLASVRRLSAVFDHYTGPAGTIILARLHGCAPAGNEDFAWGGVNVPLGGSGESGDGWAVAQDDRLAAGDRLAALVVDGLGHGPQAAAAAQAAIAAFSACPVACPVAGPEKFLRRAHEAMRGTRGGVLGVCVIDPARGELVYAGVGNISGLLLYGASSHGLVSHDGTAGTELALPRARELTHQWGPDATLILASDGIRRHWEVASYPGLLRRDPAVIAAILYRDYQRGTDDATVLVVRDTRGDAP